MQKNKILKFSLIGMSLLLISSCGDNIDSNSNTNSSSSSEDVNHNYEYKLEDNEYYQKVNVITENLTALNYDTIPISGVEKVVTNPYGVSYWDDAVIRYPTNELLRGQNILYTSMWYSQYTFNRSEECVEYVLKRDNNQWVVSSISNHSNTFIPFNGAVLSVPKGGKVAYQVNDVVGINYNAIPIYDIGFYNQDGNRLVANAANRLTWKKSYINLFDSNSLGLITDTAYTSVASINFYYDEKNNNYVVDKFRNLTSNGQIYTNVNDGFMLGATINNNSAANGMDVFPVIEGVRFNLNDTIQVEENAALHNVVHKYSTSGINDVTLDDGSVISFTLTKLTNDSDRSHKYEYEVGVDANSSIVSTGSFVNVPNGGYKIAIRCAKNTDGETLNRILENNFVKGDDIVINGSEVTVTSNTINRSDIYYNLVAKYVRDTIEQLETENYSYDYETIYKCNDEIKEIGTQIDELIEKGDATSLFRVYNLVGNVNQIYYKVLSATNRNEAVQIKTCWYISDFGTRDYSLTSIQKTLDTIKKSGFNEIIVDAIPSGTANYSNSEVYKQNGTLKNKNYGEYEHDFLKAIIAEGHKRGMKVFGGLTPFNANYAKNWPELESCYALDINGKDNSFETNNKMLDPANDLVQEKLKISINDILKSNPDIDGISLDYIRYDADNNILEHCLGITEAAREKFVQFLKQKNLNYSINSLNDLRSLLRSNNQVFAYFNEMQTELITKTVQNVKDVCLDYDKPLTCAVGEGTYFKNFKAQDWVTWAKNGYVDALYLMDYYFDETWVNYYVEEAVKAVDNQCLIVGGVDPSYANLIPEYYARTVKGALQCVNSSGYGVFGTHTQFGKKQAWDLLEDTNYIESLSPYDSLKDTMKAFGDKLLERSNNIYMKNNNQTASQKEELNKDLEALYKLITGDNETSCNNVINKLNEMKNKTYASNKAINRINEQFDLMISTAKMKLNTVR